MENLLIALGSDKLTHRIAALDELKTRMADPAFLRCSFDTLCLLSKALRSLIESTVQVKTMTSAQLAFLHSALSGLITITASFERRTECCLKPLRAIVAFCGNSANLPKTSLEYILRLGEVAVGAVVSEYYKTPYPESFYPENLVQICAELPGLFAKLLSFARANLSHGSRTQTAALALANAVFRGHRLVEANEEPVVSVCMSLLALIESKTPGRFLTSLGLAGRAFPLVLGRLFEATESLVRLLSAFHLCMNENLAVDLFAIVRAINLVSKPNKCPELRLLGLNLIKQSIALGRADTAAAIAELICLEPQELSGFPQSVIARFIAETVSPSLPVSDEVRALASCSPLACLALVAALICPRSSLSDFPNLNSFLPVLGDHNLSYLDILNLAGLFEGVIEASFEREFLDTVALASAGGLLYRLLAASDALHERFAQKVLQIARRALAGDLAEVGRFALPLSGLSLLLPDVTLTVPISAEICLGLDIFEAAKWLIARQQQSSFVRLEHEHRAICAEMDCRFCDELRFNELRSALRLEESLLPVVTSRAPTDELVKTASDIVQVAVSSEARDLFKWQRVAKSLLIFRLLSGEVETESLSAIRSQLASAVKSSTALENALVISKLSDAGSLVHMSDVLFGDPVRLDYVPLARKPHAALWNPAVSPIPFSSSEMLAANSRLILQRGTVSDLLEGPLVAEILSRRYAEGIAVTLSSLVHRLCLTFDNSVVFQDFADIFLLTANQSSETLRLICLASFIRYSSERRVAAAQFVKATTSGSLEIAERCLRSHEGELWRIWLLAGLLELCEKGEITSLPDSLPLAELQTLAQDYSRNGINSPQLSHLRFLNLLVIEAEKIGSDEVNRLVQIFTKSFRSTISGLKRRFNEVYLKSGFAIELFSSLISQTTPVKKPRNESVSDTILRHIVESKKPVDYTVAFFASVFLLIVEIDTDDAVAMFAEAARDVGNVTFDKVKRFVSEVFPEGNLGIPPVDSTLFRVVQGESGYCSSLLADICRAIGESISLPLPVLRCLCAFDSISKECVGLLLHLASEIPAAAERFNQILKTGNPTRKTVDEILRGLHCARSLFRKSRGLELPGRSSPFWGALDLDRVCEIALKLGLRHEAFFWATVSVKLVGEAKHSDAIRPWSGLFEPEPASLQILSDIYLGEGFTCISSRDWLRASQEQSKSGSFAVDYPVEVVIAQCKEMRKHSQVVDARKFLHAAITKFYGQIDVSLEVQLLFEFAKCLITDGNTRALELSKALSEWARDRRVVPDKLAADILSKTGVWLASHQSMTSSEILEEYLRPAVELVAQTDFHSPRLRRVQLIDAVISGISDLGGVPSSELIDEAFQDLVFLMNLKEQNVLSKKKSLWVTSRFLSYWFGFGPKFPKIPQSICKSSSLNPTLLAPFCYQIFSRLTRSDDAMMKVVGVMLKGQPHECIPALLQLRQGDESRREVVDKILVTARANIPKLKELIESYRELFKFYEVVADKQVTGRSGGDLAELVGVRDFEKLVSRELYLITGSVPGIRIARIERQFTIAETGLSAPKILTVIDEFGNRHRQVVKGKDDLRNDAVMQQLFGILNEVCGLSLRTYKVVPLSPESGVIEWVENTMTIGNYLAGGEGKEEGSAHVRYFPGDIKPSVFRKRMVDARTGNQDLKATLTKNSASFHPVFDMFFFEKFPVATDFVRAHLRYVKSLAETSIIGFVCGISDRHPNNILIDYRTGDLVHIDFGMCFDQGKSLRIPECVPFRLTPDLVAALGPAGMKGPFLSLCQRTMAKVREQKNLVISIIEVFLHDPLYRWRDNVEGARTAVTQVKRKLQGFVDEEPLPLESRAQVERLVQRAMDPARLSQLFAGWQPWL